MAKKAENNILIPPGRRASFSGRNPRCMVRNPKAGRMWLFELEVERDVWDSLDSIPDDAIVECVVRWHYGDSDGNEPRATDVAGPYAGFWRIMFRRRFHYDAMLCELLGRKSGEVKDALHDVFEVDSMSEVGPPEFLDYCNSNDLLTLAVVTHQAQAEFEHAQAAASAIQPEGGVRGV